MVVARTTAHTVGVHIPQHIVAAQRQLGRVARTDLPGSLRFALGLLALLHAQVVTVALSVLRETILIDLLVNRIQADPF